MIPIKNFIVILLCMFTIACVKSEINSTKDDLAPTPPMGWNSWDCFGTTVTEEEVKANAEYMSKHLLQFGWQYIVVDIQWYEPNAKSHGYRKFATLDMDEPYMELLKLPTKRYMENL